MSRAAQFRAEAAKRILVKDGAYGTLIQAEKLPERAYAGDLGLSRDQRGNNDLLNLTRPEVVRTICERFADAGADVLATNTFNANRISQADFGAEELVGEINRAAARTVREVADRVLVLVAGQRHMYGAMAEILDSPEFEAVLNGLADVRHAS